MTDPLEAAKKIAAPDPGGEPEPPCEHAELKQRRPCCGHRWLCTSADCDKEGLVARGDYCRTRCGARVKPGEDAEGTEMAPVSQSTPPGAPRLPALSMIFTVYDEDPAEVRRTLESAEAAYPPYRLELVVVDDGAEAVRDAVRSAETRGAEVTYLRNETNRGVGRARNQGYAAARDDADVVSFHDAHMRFPLYDEMMRLAAGHDNELNIPEGWSSLMALAERAARLQPCILSSASRDTRKDRDFWSSGADLFWNRRDGLQPKWRMPGTWDTQWQRVPCMMGAGYFMSRGTARALADINAGRGSPDAAGVWEDIVGKWGFSEQALSVKAYMLGIGVWAARDIYTRHLYRSRNPVGGAGKEVWKNVCRCTSRLFPRGIYERRFRPYVRKRLGEDGEAEHRAEPAGLADREQCRQVFTDLLGKGAPVSDRHPDHDWLDRLKREVADMPGRPSVLMWRPGEAAMRIKYWRPEADVTCIARPGPRANNWWDICRANGIDIVKAKLTEDYVKRPVNRDWGPFDIVLINGPLQDECRKSAKRALAEDGRIICNDRKDTLQLEDDQRRKEEKDVEAALKKRDTSRITVSGGVDGAHEVTVLLLNWRRPENLDEILEALAAQTVEPRVWLWDNSGEFDGDDRVDCIFGAGRNIGGMARWWIASAAETEFVCSLDDDLKPTDAEVLEDMMHACMAREEPGIVGPFGWRGRGQFMPGGSPPYKGGQHISAGEENVAVDVVKGRCMLLERRLLRRVPLEPPLPDDADIDRAELLKRCDDIYLNIMIGRGQPERHVVPRVVQDRFEDVGGQDGRALATDAGHYDTRERAIEALLRYWDNRG